MHCCKHLKTLRWNVWLIVWRSRFVIDNSYNNKKPDHHSFDLLFWYFQFICCQRLFHWRLQHLFLGCTERQNLITSHCSFWKVWVILKSCWMIWENFSFFLMSQIFYYYFVANLLPFRYLVKVKLSLTFFVFMFSSSATYQTPFSTSQALIHIWTSNWICQVTGLFTVCNTFPSILKFFTPHENLCCTCCFVSTNLFCKCQWNFLQFHFSCIVDSLF
jgi:hypothetical protein